MPFTRFGDPDIAAITLRVPRSMHVALKQASELSGCSVNAYAREALVVRMTWQYALMADMLDPDDVRDAYVRGKLEEIVHDILTDVMGA